MFLGEFPELPPELIRTLHRRTMDVEVKITDTAWDIISQGWLEGWSAA